MSRPNDASTRYTPASHQYQNYNEQLSRLPSQRSQVSSRSPSPRRYRPRRRRYSSRSRSRSRSPPPRRRDSKVSFVPSAEKEPKPWYKKKTLWATLASAATIAALVPTTLSARGSIASAQGSHRSADAVEKSSKAAIRSADAAEQSAEASSKAAIAALRSAHAVEKSTQAAIRSAHAVEKSSKATVHTAMANGHMDEKGNYIPPAPAKKIEAPPVRDQRLLDYEPLRKVFTAADMATGYAKAR